ncbi:hypothetical protein M409DRAFT_61801, partial [Zasmidium cellare ATCC 36951]
STASVTTLGTPSNNTLAEQHKPTRSGMSTTPKASNIGFFKRFHSQTMQTDTAGAPPQRQPTTPRTLVEQTSDRHTALHATRDKTKCQPAVQIDYKTLGVQSRQDDHNILSGQSASMPDRKANTQTTDMIEATNFAVRHRSMSMPTPPSITLNRPHAPNPTHHHSEIERQTPTSNDEAPPPSSLPSEDSSTSSPEHSPLPSPTYSQYSAMPNEDADASTAAGASHREEPNPRRPHHETEDDAFAFAADILRSIEPEDLRNQEQEEGGISLDPTQRSETCTGRLARAASISPEPSTGRDPSQGSYTNISDTTGEPSSLAHASEDDESDGLETASEASNSYQSSVHTTSQEAHEPEDDLQG